MLTKPDAQTPYAALWAVELLEEAGMQGDGGPKIMSTPAGRRRPMRVEW